MPPLLERLRAVKPKRKTKGKDGAGEEGWTLEVEIEAMCMIAIGEDYRSAVSDACRTDVYRTDARMKCGNIYCSHVIIACP